MFYRLCVGRWFVYHNSCTRTRAIGKKRFILFCFREGTFKKVFLSSTALRPCSDVGRTSGDRWARVGPRTTRYDRTVRNDGGKSPFRAFVFRFAAAKKPIHSPAAFSQECAHVSRAQPSSYPNSILFASKAENCAYGNASRPRWKTYLSLSLSLTLCTVIVYFRSHYRVLGHVIKPFYFVRGRFHSGGGPQIWRGEKKKKEKIKKPFSSEFTHTRALAAIK